MSELDEASALLRAAKRDLNALLGMAQVKQFFSDEIFGLHVQQAVEKIIKTWLIVLGETYPRIHNLDALFRLLEKAGCDISKYQGFAEFTPFGTQFRYEDLISEAEPINREATITQVQDFYKHVEMTLQAAMSKDDEAQ